MFSNEKVLGIFPSFSSQHRLIRKKNAQPQNLYAESFRTLATSFLLIVKVGWDGRWLFYVILCRIHATTSIGEDLKTSFDGRDSDISECIEQFPCSLIIQLKLQRQHQLHHTGPAVFQYSKPVFPPAAAPSFPIFRHFFNSIFGKF